MRFCSFSTSLARFFIAQVERNTILKKTVHCVWRQIRRKFAIMLIISPLYGIPRNHLYNEFKHIRLHTNTQLLCECQWNGQSFVNLACGILHWNLVERCWNLIENTAIVQIHTHTSRIVKYLFVTYSLVSLQRSVFLFVVIKRFIPPVICVVCACACFKHSSFLSRMVSCCSYVFLSFNAK